MYCKEEMSPKRKFKEAMNICCSPFTWSHLHLWTDWVLNSLTQIIFNSCFWLCLGFAWTGFLGEGKLKKIELEFGNSGKYRCIWCSWQEFQCRLSFWIAFGKQLWTQNMCSVHECDPMPSWQYLDLNWIKWTQFWKRNIVKFWLQKPHNEKSIDR